jgi:hypothetical protein
MIANATNGRILTSTQGKVSRFADGFKFSYLTISFAKVETWDKMANILGFT